ncbi:uncharacterized protein LOC143693987 [Agelaius phoeniceus]|uniref:uncharacterized protein LOC143693987 n=1 Tax=Agelaius phoeniceus TaxID=39638 RepID=UPI004054DB90
MPSGHGGDIRGDHGLHRRARGTSAWSPAGRAGQRQARVCGGAVRGEPSARCRPFPGTALRREAWPPPLAPAASLRAALCGSGAAVAVGIPGVCLELPRRQSFGFGGEPSSLSAGTDSPKSPPAGEAVWVPEFLLQSSWEGNSCPHCPCTLGLEVFWNRDLQQAQVASARPPGEPQPARTWLQIY